jgi:hypothetical protein
MPDVLGEGRRILVKQFGDVVTMEFHCVEEYAAAVLYETLTECLEQGRVIAIETHKLEHRRHG